MTKITNNFTSVGNSGSKSSAEAKDKFVVTTYYKFVDLPHYEDIRVKLLSFCNKNNIKGTILLAREGINSTVTGTRTDIDNFYGFITSIPEFADLTFKESFCDFIPFKRMKVKLKKEIVTIKEGDLDLTERGTYLDAEAWDEMLADPEAIIVDTRNDFEYRYGTFENAINPKTERFSEIGAWVDHNLTDADKERPIVMFCTGGIRCEKSTALMKRKGFKNVYHLEGGILGYFEEKERGKKSHKWQGSCFVFDDRIALKPDLTRVEDVVDERSKPK
jgi:UPF0176 protein